ncbi:hypothetical protein B0H19DRAFT_1085596 [Mycena capillaripes]|nr:hypothetical protein B0H19DRAFT_1085596 [Mycena capillaripes]
MPGLGLQILQARARALGTGPEALSPGPSPGFLTAKEKKHYCRVSFNSDVTRHRAKNFRKYSNLSRVTEGIFECVGKVTKFAKTAKKIEFSRVWHVSVIGGVIGAFSGSSGIFRLLGGLIIALGSTEWTKKGSKVAVTGHTPIRIDRNSTISIYIKARACQAWRAWHSLSPSPGPAKALHQDRLGLIKPGPGLARLAGLGRALQITTQELVGWDQCLVKAEARAKPGAVLSGFPCTLDRLRSSTFRLTTQYLCSDLNISVEPWGVEAFGLICLKTKSPRYKTDGYRRPANEQTWSPINSNASGKIGCGESNPRLRAMRTYARKPAMYRTPRSVKYIRIYFSTTYRIYFLVPLHPEIDANSIGILNASLKDIPMESMVESTPEVYRQNIIFSPRSICAPIFDFFFWAAPTEPGGTVDMERNTALASYSACALPGRKIPTHSAGNSRWVFEDPIDSEAANVPAPSDAEQVLSVQFSRKFAYRVLERVEFLATGQWSRRDLAVKGREVLRTLS